MSLKLRIQKLYQVGGGLPCFLFSLVCQMSHCILSPSRSSMLPRVRLRFAFRTWHQKLFVAAMKPRELYEVQKPSSSTIERNTSATAGQYLDLIRRSSSCQCAKSQPIQSGCKFSGWGWTLFIPGCEPVMDMYDGAGETISTTQGKVSYGVNTSLHLSWASDNRNLIHLSRLPRATPASPAPKRAERPRNGNSKLCQDRPMKLTW